MSKQQSSTLVFPTYLIPTFNFPISLPFRKRHLSSASTSSQLSRIVGSPSNSPPISPTSPQQSLRSLPSLTPISSTSTTPSTPTLTLTLQTPHPPILRCKTCSTHLAYKTQIISKGFTGRHGRAYLISPPPPQPLSTTLPFPPRKQEKNLVNIKVGKCMRRELVTGQHSVADIECAVCGGVVGWKYVDARELGQRYKVGKFILERARVVGGRGWEWGGVERGEGEEEGEEDDGEEEGGGGGYFNNFKFNTNDGIFQRGGGRDNTQFDPTINKKKNPYHHAPNTKPNDRFQFSHHNTHLAELEIEMGRRKPDDEMGDCDDEIVIFDEDDEDECDELFAGVWDAEVVRRRRWRRDYGGGGVSLWRRREMGEEGWGG